MTKNLINIAILSLITFLVLRSCSHFPVIPDPSNLDDEIYVDPSEEDPNPCPPKQFDH